MVQVPYKNNHSVLNYNSLNRKYCNINSQLDATIYIFLIYTWVRASWIELNNCPTRCDIFSLLHFCRQLYMFRVLTPIIRSWCNCNYRFWYWLTGSTTIRFRCWVGTDSCVSYGRYQLLMMRVNTRNMYSCLQKCNKLSHILLDSY